MGRPAKFARKDVASAALRLVSERGPQALTVAALASELGAPTGSIYHRYESRELLLAELWMDVVESFQSELVSWLSKANDVEGAVRCTRAMLTWIQEHHMQARLLLLHRRQDFVAGRWPAALSERATRLEPELARAVQGFSKRAFGRADRALMARVRFALLDAPFGGIKPYLQVNQPVPPILAELVESTVRAVLAAQKETPQ